LNPESGGDAFVDFTVGVPFLPTFGGFGPRTGVTFDEGCHYAINGP
jgi:hypothetical protein